MAEGHRERLRRRFLEENIDTIPDYIVLEMMLYGIISRRDTCETARELIKTFGGLSQVIDAPVSELCKVPGMGETAAQFIKLIPQFYRKYRLEKWGRPTVLDSIESAANYLADHFIGYGHEVVIVLCLDANGRFISCRPVFEGTINAVDISVRKILQFSLSNDAARIIIAHNHLNGDALPSDDDLRTTLALYKALESVDIQLDDHIIVIENDHISFAQSGYLSYIRKIAEEEKK